MRGSGLVGFAAAYTAVVMTAALTVPTQAAGLQDAGTPDHTAPDHTAHDHTAHDHHSHDHSDQTTKNALSRSTEPVAADPTTAQEAASARDAVAEQRAEPDPALVPSDLGRDRQQTPEDRYAMAGGCYTLHDARTARPVQKYEDGYRVATDDAQAGEPVHFQATDLGSYLLFDHAQRFVAEENDAPLETGNDRVVAADRPSPRADWGVAEQDTPQGTAYTFTLPGEQQSLAVADDGTLALAATPTPFSLRLTTGCAKYPEIETNVDGAPHAGATPIQEVRGWWDAHTHGMAYE
nr:hypothetical protein [Actinomycetota bacterium]